MSESWTIGTSPEGPSFFYTRSAERANAPDLPAVLLAVPPVPELAQPAHDSQVTPPKIVINVNRVVVPVVVRDKQGHAARATGRKKISKSMMVAKRKLSLDSRSKSARRSKTRRGALQ